jgi:hypothetical protein
VLSFTMSVAISTSPAFAGATDVGTDDTTTSGHNNDGNGTVDLIGTQPGTPGNDDTGDFFFVDDGDDRSSDDSICLRIVDNRCYVRLARPAEAEPGTPTLTDIASFRPIVGTAHMQPNGWGVVGIHTNFYSTGDAHVVTGTLLGQPASVRFTPVGWHWDYGDGTAASVGAPGGTWAQLGIREFDATPGSHVYASKASYTVHLSIEYAAEYQYAGQPWLPIAGTLLLAANDLAITTWNVKTVLVAEDCLDDPNGPGCPGG